MKTPIALALVLSLLAAPLHADSPPDSSSNDPALLAECGVAIVVIGGGIVIYVQLNKLCKKLPKTNTGPPPTKPTNSTSIVRFDLPPGNPIRLTLPDAPQYDIADLGYRDERGFTYYAYSEFALLSSTNLTQWNAETKIRAWISQSSIVVASDQATNWVNRQASVEVAAGISATSGSKLFYVGP